MKKEQNNSDNTKVGPVCATTVILKEQFKEFYTFLKIIKPHFKDLCIFNGVVRSRNNDRSIIVETSFTYFENLSFHIDDIKFLVKMLSNFDKKTDITITTDEKITTFTDGFKRAHVTNAGYESIDNGYITDEEMNKKYLEDFDIDNLFIKETLPKAVVCTINKMTRVLNVKAISIKHKVNNSNKGYILISNHPKYQNSSNYPEYIIELKEDFLTPMIENQYFSVKWLPFRFNKGDMTFNYYLQKDRLVIGAIYNTRVDRLFINIYQRASLIKDDE